MPSIFLCQMLVQNFYRYFCNTRQVVFVFVLTIISPFGFAQEFSSSQHFTEDDFTSDIPIVISASKLPQRDSEAPESISIIDRDTIKALGVINIADIFRLVAGFQVAHVTGNVFAVTYHGLSYDYPRRLQVLIDGRSVYRPLLSNVDWANLGISVSDIERIEVIRGPNTPSYGSNAFLGTINIVTREPFQDQGYRIEYIKGTENFQKVFIKYAGNVKKLEYRVTAEYRKSHGFDNVDDSREISSGSVRSIYNINAFSNVEAQFGYSGGSMGADGNASLLNPVRDKQITSNYSFLRWNKTLSKAEDIHIQFYQNYYKQADIFYVGPLSLLSPLLPNEFVELGVFDGVGERIDFEFQHNINFGSHLHLVWGVGVRNDRIQGKKILDKDGYIEDSSSRLFSSVKWQAEKNTIVNVGAIYESNDIVGELFSPRFAVNYKMSNSKALRFSAAKAFRSPSLYEANNKVAIRQNDGTLLHVNFDHDPNLSAEELVSYEFAYIGKLAEVNVAYDIKIFKEQITNFISAPEDLNYPQPALPVNLSSSQAKIWKNGGDVSSKGIETQIIYTASSKSSLHISYAYVNATGALLETLNPDARDDLSNNVPTYTVSALWQQKVTRDWLGSVAYYRVAAMEWGGGGDLVDGYDRWDMHVLKTLRFSGNKGEIGLTIQNIADKKYQEFRVENEFNRRLYLQIKLSL